MEQEVASVADRIAQSQQGVISRAQLMMLGLTRAQAWQQVRSGRWQSLFPGVYATFTGPVPEIARIWAAILFCGRGARASHWTALRLADPRRPEPDGIHVAVPADRRVVAPWPIVVHHTRNLPSIATGRPPRTSVEATLLDCADTVRPLSDLLGLVFQVTQRRLTSAPLLATELTGRSRHRWRAELAKVLAEVRDGVTSPLEHEYLIRVERPHGLPHGLRNRPERRPEGTRYRDVRYPLGVVVELDGREAHPDGARFRDMRRDNQLVVEAEVPLRFGWHDVLTRPCTSAHQVATVLTHRGWPNRPRSCSPRCAIGRL